MLSVDRTSRLQRLYREVNGRIREVSESFGANGPAEFLCECGRDDCTATIEFNHAQYDALLSHDNCVLLAAVHADAIDGHRVVTEDERFLLVAS